MKKKISYVAMSADLIHPGHLNIISHARKYGEVIIGLLSDKAIASYKRVPIMDFKDRFAVVSSLKHVSRVVVQDTHDYVKNLKKFLHLEVLLLCSSIINETKGTFLIETFANSTSATENLTPKGANIGTIVQMAQ
jgi:cytidyltransferase-like protein